MESIMEQIWTRLQAGETPQELIKNGFKRTTVYSIAKKLDTKGGPGIDNQIAYLACLLREIYFDLSLDIHSDDLSFDPDKAWRDIVATANELYADDTKKRPPKEFMF